MDNETLEKMVEYSDELLKKYKNLTHVLMWIGFIGVVISTIISRSNIEEMPFIDFISGLGTGLALGTLLVGILYTSKYFDKVVNYKERYLARKNKT